MTTATEAVDLTEDHSQDDKAEVMKKIVEMNLQDQEQKVLERIFKKDPKRKKFWDNVQGETQEVIAHKREAMK